MCGTPWWLRQISTGRSTAATWTPEAFGTRDSAVRFQRSRNSVRVIPIARQMESIDSPLPRWASEFFDKYSMVDLGRVVDGCAGFPTRVLAWSVCCFSSDVYQRGKDRLVCAQ